MRQISLVTDLKSPLIISADEHRLRQVLVNLLSNAVKFTPEEGQITIRTALINHEALIEVSDTGPGISEEDLPFLFDRFYRADASRHRDSGGSGIGLTIVKLIIDAHQGRIDVQSLPGEGATFRIILPLKPISS
jgi:signal transduction histidine kinase